MFSVVAQSGFSPATLFLPVQLQSVVLDLVSQGPSNISKFFRNGEPFFKRVYTWLEKRGGQEIVASNRQVRVGVPESWHMWCKSQGYKAPVSTKVLFTGRACSPLQNFQQKNARQAMSRQFSTWGAHSIVRSPPHRVFDAAPYSVSKLFYALPVVRRTYSTSSSHDETVPQAEYEELINDADYNSTDAMKQADLLKVMALRAPLDAIKRFESGQYASNDACVKSYIAALVAAKRLNQTNLNKIFSGLNQMDTATMSNSTRTMSNSRGAFSDSKGAFSPKPLFGFAAPLPSNGSVEGLGTLEQPLHFVKVEPSLKAKIFDLLKYVVFLLIAMSALSQLMEDKGLGGKGGPFSREQILPDVTAHNITFADVQGVDEAKDELVDVVEFLRNPASFTRLGGKLPKGVLLTGPPGTGKTLLAKAVAGEAGVPFFYCSGSDFDEMFVGVGARRIRELFVAAKKRAPCIIFMDEIDAVGGKRSPKDQQFAKMTLNQLLVELDGFNTNDNVIVIAATNFPEMLDPALVRPGRFDTHVTVPLPDVRGRLEILKAHAKKLTLDDTDKTLWNIARGCVGFSGAELANLLNQAALKASRDKMDTIDLKTLEWAKDKILMGAERTKAVITEKDKACTAYHEAGHALCALYTEGATPVYKATIVPRGRALGMVQQLPEDDTNSMSKKEYHAKLIVLMGGRAAEERIYGKEEITSGASSDYQMATNLARAMVTKYAMSEKVGPISISEGDTISGFQRQLIDSEVKRLCQDALDGAMALLKTYDTEHHRLAKALLEHETLTAEEMKRAVKGEVIKK